MSTLGYGSKDKYNLEDCAEVITLGYVTGGVNFRYVAVSGTIKYSIIKSFLEVGGIIGVNGRIGICSYWVLQLKRRSN